MITAFIFITGLFLASLLGTRLLIMVLENKAIFDVPNERSSHTDPTPRGGGLVVTALLFLSWSIYLIVFDPHFGAFEPIQIWALGGGACLLGALSFLDDLFTLSARLRLMAQIVVVVIVTPILNGEGTVFQGFFPPLMDQILMGLVWIAFLNFFNFMDGINGITSVQTISMSVGLAIIGSSVWSLSALTPLSLMVIASMLGFAVWNWGNAKIFLGDVGSIPLGFVLAGLCFLLAAQGYWASAMILPSYYCLDAGITLMRRLLRKEKIWQAHREHFYQRAVQGPASHAQISTVIATANLFLVFLSFQAMESPFLAVAGACVINAILFLMLIKLARMPAL